MKSRKLSIVFWVSLIIAAVFIAWGTFFPENVETILGAIDGFIATNLGWFYMLVMTFFVLFAIFMVVTPFGRIKLGRPDEKPEYSYFTWFAFLFTAGMGVGLVFFGVTEPLTHYHNPPSEDPGSMAAAEESLQHTIFHWGFHPWAVYAVVGLALAYFKFRHHSPILMSSALTPLLGERAKGPLGHSVDVLAVFGTIFGIATSLGLGATQITAGLSFSFEAIDNNIFTQLLVVLIITVAFVTSAVTGVNKGIRYLSWMNIVVAIGLMVFVFVLGSSVQMIDSFMTTTGNYLQNIPSMTFDMNAFTGERDFLNDWTLFYWAWWIGWSAFVGSFIARVSRGRTIREFVIGVVTVPFLFSAIWFAILGVAGIETDNAVGGALYELVQTEGDEVALFAFLESLPLDVIVIGIAVLLIASFFVTSADAGTFVLGMLTTGGRLNPSLQIKVIWGAILSGTAAVLLFSGGLQALEMAMLIAAFPFAFVVILLAISLVKALSNEYDILRLESKQQEFEPDYQEESKRELEEKREEFEQSLPDEDVDIEGEEKQ
ncbi:BCCT family transporter [Salicibibacter halophilus]|uniref:BCCT family transporter n=1 Tax=Salicibibacter halophilus TaxID=2502791 RepID=A0A514LHH0_9BACI|nr:BCCT family transporter [Salicibibacter halophilus]QDI90731.1 BCCT family transporter [Salicibibacter halophilus]